VKGREQVVGSPKVRSQGENEVRIAFGLPRRGSDLLFSGSPRANLKVRLSGRFSLDCAATAHPCGDYSRPNAQLKVAGCFFSAFSSQPERARYVLTMPDKVEAPSSPTPRPILVAIVTVSDTRTLETDTSGGALVEFVKSAGHVLTHRSVVTDDEALIQKTVRMHVQDDGVEAVLITGGTGITSRDVTPEAIAPLVTKHIPGFGELFRMLSYDDIGAATIQSRAFAALCSKTLVFALPGSTSAVRFAVEKILRAQLDVRTKPCNFAQLLPRIS
jgi:molybdopterin adenylyltransferase